MLTLPLGILQPTGNKGMAPRVQEPSRIPCTSKPLTRVKCRRPTIPLVDTHPLLPSRKEAADSWAVDWELVWRVVLWEDCCLDPCSEMVVEAAVVAVVVDVEAKLFGESALYSQFWVVCKIAPFFSFCGIAVTAVISLAVKANRRRSSIAYL